MDKFIDENGRRGWARCTQSIQHRSCPPLINSHNIVRAHLGCSGTIYTETDTPGVLDVVTLYDCDTKGVPAWLTKFVALRKAKNAHLLEHLVRLARAANDSLVADFTQMVPQKTEKACFGCGEVLSKWNVGGRKCRECKEVCMRSGGVASVRVLILWGVFCCVRCRTCARAAATSCIARSKAARSSTASACTAWIPTSRPTANAAEWICIRNRRRRNTPCLVNYRVQVPVGQVCCLCALIRFT